MKRQILLLGKINGFEDGIVEALLDPGEEHHLRSVLRAKIGTEIEIRDLQESLRASGSLITCSNSKVSIRSPEPEKLEQNKDIYLIWGLPKKKSAELIVEKAVECNVSGVYFFTSDKNRNHGWDKMYSRFDQIARAALKQCGACKLPNIALHASMQSAIEEAKKSNPIFYYAALPEEGGVRLPLTEIPRSPSIAIIGGAEEGLSEGEIAIAEDHAKARISLGENILRTATAAIIIMGIAALKT